MSKEAMKQWADDVSKAYDILAFGHTERAAEILAKTRNAMREELAEPTVKQSCVACEGNPQFPNSPCTLCGCVADQPAQQEPVAFLVDGDLYYPEEIDWETLQEQGHTVASLYTSTPAQRTWVGLTDREEVELWDSTVSDWELMKRIEAKLKEKNT